MSKCIQIRVGDRVFKFDGIDLDNVVYSTRGIINAIKSDSRYANTLEDFINSLSLSYKENTSGEIKDATVYADTVLGDINPLALAATMRDSGKSEEETDILVSLIGKNSENIIKINESLKEPVIYLGSNRTLIGVPSSSINSQQMINALEYVYLDSKIRNTASNVFKTIDNLWYDFKEETLKNGNEVSSAFLRDLDKLDSINRNKRLLAYLFNNSLNEENLDLFTEYKMKLKSIVESSIKLKGDFYKGRTDASLYSLFNLNNPKPVKLSNKVSTTLGEVATLLKDYRTVNNKITAKDIVGETPSGISPKSYLSTLVIDKLLEINPSGSYDVNIFSKYTPSQIEFIGNHADMLYELVDATEGTPQDIEAVLQDIIISNRPVGKSDMPISNVKVEIGKDLIVNSSRRIKFSSYNSDLSKNSSILKIEFNPNNHSDYKLEKNVLWINPAKFNYNTVLDIPNFPKGITSVYMPYKEGYTEVYSEVLRALSNSGYIREFKTDGLESQSVRLAIEANNLGLNITVHPANGELRSRIGEDISAKDFVDRFSYIMPPLPGSLQPSLSFYDWKSSNGYEFTNRKGNLNLNELLSQMEEDLPTERYLDYFDLTVQGIIDNLIVSSKTKDNGPLLKTNTGTIIDLMDSKSGRMHKFSIQNKYKLNGSFEKVNSNSLEIGDVYNDNTYTYIVLSSTDADVSVVKYIKDTKLKIESIPKELFEKLTPSDYKVIYRNGLLNLHNKAFIQVNGEIKMPSLQDLYDFYDLELSNISERSGFSKEFIKRKKFSNKDSFENMTILQLRPEGEVLDNEPHDLGLPNFNGKLFIERLAHKLNTPIHFLTTLQMNGLGENFGKAKGLIYNGEVYINMDKFNDDKGVVLHELSHIILAYFKENNYEGYLSLLNSLTIEPSKMNELRELYPELTNQDLLEEYLAERFSNSFNTLFADPLLDDKLSKIDFADSMNKLLELSTDISSDMRELMSSTLKEVARNSKEANKAFGEIFPRMTRTWGAISNIKSKLLKSTDEQNNLKEFNCR